MLPPLPAVRNDLNGHLKGDNEGFKVNERFPKVQWIWKIRSKDLHDHFSVTAACFLGFNLKKRPMASMLAYVAKTH